MLLQMKVFGVTAENNLQLVEEAGMEIDDPKSVDIVVGALRIGIAKLPAAIARLKDSALVQISTQHGSVHEAWIKGHAVEAAIRLMTARRSKPADEPAKVKKADGE